MKDFFTYLSVPIIMILLVLSFGAVITWYKAGVQQAVYARQGIHMTRAELFWGAKPAERTITIKGVDVRGVQ